MGAINGILMGVYAVVMSTSMKSIIVYYYIAINIE